jgi:hypothetical protein
MATKREPPLLADYLPERSFARQINQKLRTLWSWRTKGIGPPWVKIGKAVYYGKPGALSWIQSNERQPVRAA